MKWIDPKDYNLNYDAVQVLCEVTQPTTSDLPRSCEMPISSGDHGVGDQFVSIGWRDDEGDWHVAGWDMMQDFWCEARCYIVRGWQPLADIWPNQYQATNMTEEATAIERDAARYRWLKSRDLDTIQNGGVFAGLTPENVVLNGNDLDRHIDAEMANSNI